MKLEIDESTLIDINSEQDLEKHLDLSKICTLEKESGYFLQWFAEDGEFEIARRYGTGDSHFRADLEEFDPATIKEIFKRFFAGDQSWHDQFGIDWEKGPEKDDPDVEYFDLGEFEPQ